MASLNESQFRNLSLEEQEEFVALGNKVVDDEKSIPSQIGSAALRTLDVAGAPVRTALSEGIEAVKGIGETPFLPEEGVAGIPAAAGRAFTKTFGPIFGEGEAPTFGDIREQVGVKPEDLSVPLPVDVPGIGKSLELAPSVDVVGGALTDPLSFATGGPAKEIVKKGGKSLFKSGLKNVDEAVEETSRGAKPFSDLAQREGFTGSNKEILKQTEDFIERLGQRREALFDRADELGITIDVNKALAPARKKVSGLHSASLPRTKAKAKSFDDILNSIEGPLDAPISQGSFTVPARAGTEGGRRVKAGEFLVPERAPVEGGRRVSAGQVPLSGVPAKTQSKSSIQTTSPAFGGSGAKPSPQVSGGSFPISKVEGPAVADPITGSLSPAAGKPGVPATSVPIEGVQGAGQIKDIGGGIKSVAPAASTPGVPATTVPITKNPAKRLNPVTQQIERIKNKLSLDEATSAKTEFAEQLPDSAFGKFGKLKGVEKKVHKKLQEGFKKEVVRAANKGEGGLGSEIDLINKDFQTAFAALKPLKRAAKSDAKKNAITSVDAMLAGFGFASPVAGGGALAAKKAIDIGKTTRFRTGAGRGLQRGADIPGLDTVLRRGVIEAGQ